ncbi:MAG TPA: hypothetical protein VFL82_15105, partial [Thermomicrobiales bacterium]|nr:hypothetical protein [Thermomicrobiales bacterium]
IVGHEAQWLASDPGNQPGVFMPSTSKVGQTFAQEQAPGVAEDTSTIGAVNQNVTVVAGSFSGCIQTKDFDPLNNDTEFKTYCPGIGLVREEYESGGHLDLIRFEGGVPATPRAGG